MSWNQDRHSGDSSLELPVLENYGLSPGIRLEAAVLDSKQQVPDTNLLRIFWHILQGVIKGLGLYLKF